MSWKVSDRQIHNESGATIATVWWYGNKGCVSKQEARETAVIMAYAPEMYAMIAGTGLEKRIKKDMERINKMGEYGKRCQMCWEYRESRMAPTKIKGEFKKICKECWEKIYDQGNSLDIRKEKA